jgi:hypothetical protein
LFDPALFFQRWRFQVDPDGLKAGEFFQRLDLFLKEAAVDKGEDVEHGESKNGQVPKVQKGGEVFFAAFERWARCSARSKATDSG